MIVFESDVPWLPSKEAPPAGAKIVQIGEDPLHARLPMRGFPSDLTITATCLSVLEALEAALRGAGHAPCGGASRATDRSGRDRCRGLARGSRTGRRGQHDHVAMAESLPARGGGSRTRWSSANIRSGRSTVRWTRPGSLFALSSAGGLGWGFPASLGAKLASPRRWWCRCWATARTCSPTRPPVIT